jgi:molecular chaperone GrpE
MKRERSINRAAQERSGGKPGAPASRQRAPEPPDTEEEVGAGDPAAGVDAAPAGAFGDSELDEALSYVDAALERGLGMPEPVPHAAAELDGEGEVGLAELDPDELAARAMKADEYLELAQRTRADFENYRKRAGREVATAQERGVARLAKELLPAIDNLDRAVQAALAIAPETQEPELGPEGQLAAGIRLVHADVIAALARVGIEPFSPVGEQFDPQYHEAVAQAPQEGALPGTVAEVYQPGYRIGETVLRPARVLVAA